MSRLNVDASCVVWLILTTLLVQIGHVASQSSCRCDRGTCKSQCDSSTRGLRCSDSDYCLRRCSCSGSKCSSFCNSTTGTSYGTAGMNCWSSDHCTTCRCSNNRCTSRCNAMGYNTYYQSCGSSTSCSSCTCSQGRCGNMCASYGTAGQLCSSETNCKTCSCVSSLRKCNSMCASYGTSGQDCTSNSACQTPPVEPPATCSCSSLQCSAGCAVSPYQSAGLVCWRNTDCSSCGCSQGLCNAYCSKTGSNYLTAGQVCNFDTDCTACSCVRGLCNLMCNREYGTPIAKVCTYNSDCGVEDYIFTTATIMPGTTEIVSTSEVIETTEVVVTTTEAYTVFEPIWFNNLSDSEILGYLSDPTQDSTPCLLNCSSSGFCSLDSDQKLFCVCDDFYTGSACQTDVRPCASQSCLNGGNCSNLAHPDTGEFYGFNCSCPDLTYGTNCEHKIDICQNVTCSGHGKCEVYDTYFTKCSCYYLYEGELCQTESASMQTVKSVMSASSIIAFIFMGLFYLFFIALDLLDYFIRRQEKTRRKTRKMTKFVYIPHEYNENAVRSIECQQSN